MLSLNLPICNQCRADHGLPHGGAFTCPEDGGGIIFHARTGQCPLNKLNPADPNIPPPTPAKPPAGVGTELAGMLSLIGMETCSRCAIHAGEMDQNGIPWCGENLETIVGWLRAAAAERKLPFSETGARWLVRIAIVKAKYWPKGDG